MLNRSSGRGGLIASGVLFVVRVIVLDVIRTVNEVRREQMRKDVDIINMASMTLPESCEITQAYRVLILDRILMYLLCPVMHASHHDGCGSTIPEDQATALTALGWGQVGSTDDDMIYRPYGWLREKEKQMKYKVVANGVVMIEKRFSD